MGKLHSKHAAVCKPRESPEGDSFVVNACLARKGIDEWMVKQKYYCTGSPLEQQDCEQKASSGAAPRDELCKDGIIDQHYRLEVDLPPEKTDRCYGEDKIQVREGADARSAQKPLKFEELQCAVSVEEDDRQEWTFTLYDFDNNGKVTREDITSLLHTIYEVVDASVNHSPSTSKTLRVKLSVAPDSSRWKGSAQTPADPPHLRQKADKWIEDPKSSDKKSRALIRRHHGEQPTQQGCQRHCVDENLERRNHYLDLAGIENYTSRFGSGTTDTGKAEPQIRPTNQSRSRSHEPENGHAHPHHRRLHTVQVEASCLRARDEDWGRHALRSPKISGHPQLVAQLARTRALKSRTAPPPPALPGHVGPYRRHKQRAKEAQQNARMMGPVSERGQERELPSLVLYEGGLGPVVQRHQHHHHHEHHHHYHHFYQS
ncbi:protein naked cuticle homolog 1-like isoform X1 [Brienomyrus brachyistius]|uniref:protein naked cuticle homolog 1-like isoform X1 n=1 Tax=Brienomyrus brachyistius TaxID=42636 RepID=UPI0020B409AA|nr:protein naked cuticle homolog 1-like isoform X1 [Brienomyrus brachyistius]